MAFQAVTWHWRKTRSDKLGTYLPIGGKWVPRWGRMTFQVEVTSKDAYPPGEDDLPGRHLSASVQHDKLVPRLVTSGSQYGNITY